MSTPAAVYPLDGRLRFQERAGAMAQAMFLTGSTGLVWQTEWSSDLARFRVVLHPAQIHHVTPTEGANT